MTSDNSFPEGSFWFAFALGSSLVMAVIFLLGTKKGRNILRKIIDQAENIDNDSLGQEIIKGIEKLASSYQNKTKVSSSPANVDSLLKKIEATIRFDKD